jgi:uncharacterized protein
MMLPLIDNQREAINDLCRRRHVTRLEVFGSAVRDDFDPEHSDIDFLVEFDLQDARALDTYFGLKEDLESLLGRPVDLVMPSAVRNPFVRARIESQRQLLYAA